MTQEEMQMARVTSMLFVLYLAWDMGNTPMIAQENKLKPALALSLESVKEVIPAGTVPGLRLTIENVGKGDEKVLKPRGDLQDTYYDLIVTKDGKALRLSRAISDPGPISEDDFLTLKPGKKVTFDLSRYAVAVHDLPAGKYQAQIRFWQDPYSSHTTAVFSPAATFTVKK
jgi:hypothetical protein